MSSRALPKIGGSSATGAAAARAGKQFERAIEAVNSWYDEQREAAIEKVNPPIVGWSESMVMLRSTVDYVGTWRPQLTRGREHPSPDWCESCGIAFDSKSVSGAAAFGFDRLPGGKNEKKHQVRFLSQVEYLRQLRDRHGYAAFFLLYCAELETLWICDQLDALARRETVRIRTKNRADGNAVEHHLPHLSARLEIAAVPRFDTRRPHMDYLSLLNSPL